MEGSTPSKTKEETSKAQASGKKKWQNVGRLFGTNNPKEGAVWHVDPLLCNGLENGTI
jgi:hypothetical protein